MSITSALVLFAVIWFMVLFITLPIRLKTQGDAGEVVDGTHASAPHEFDFKRRARLVTAIAAVTWVVIAGIIYSGVITVRDIDMFNRLDWKSVDETDG